MLYRNVPAMLFGLFEMISKYRSVVTSTKDLWTESK